MARKLEDWLESYVNHCCGISEPPTQFHRWCGLSLIAAVLQRKCCMPWGPLTFFPNLYVVIVAPSGRARKGTATSFYLHFAEKLGLSMAAEATTREALIQALAATRKSDVNPATGEVEVHSSLTVVSPELTVFLGYNNQQLMSDLTDWYDCRDRWIYRTKGQGTDEIWGVWVNLFGATTPDLIRSTLPLDAIGGGLTSRIIFVYAENKGRVIPAPMTTPADDAMSASLLHDLEEIHMLRGRFKASKGFLDRWIEWYSVEAQRYPFLDPKFGGYCERRPNHVMKLSMIVSAARRSTLEVRAEDFNTALDWLKETEVLMPQVFAGMGRLEYSDVIENVLTTIQRRKKILLRELMRIFYRDVDERRMGEILSSLQAGGFVLSRHTDEGTVVEARPDPMVQNEPKVNPS